MKSTRKRSERARGRRGSSLVLALVILAALMVFGLAAMRLSVSSNQAIQASDNDREALALAEAGLSEAIESVRSGGPGSLGDMNQPVTMGDGIFWVTATDIGENRTSLVATAMVGSGRAAVESVTGLKTDVSPLFEKVLNATEGLQLAQGVVTDSFHSTLGSYASQAVNTYNGILYAEAGGDVRSNGNLNVGTDCSVFGDAIPSPGYTVTLGNNAYVSGSTTPADADFLFASVDMPTFAKAGTISVPASGSQVLPSGDYGFTSVDIGSGGKLTVEGPATILVDSFSGKSDARLEIDARLGPVSFYVAKSYSHGGGFEAVPFVGSPMAVAFFFEDFGTSFPSNSKIRGAYYAPQGKLNLTSGCEVFGALAAETIGMASGSRFHFDEDLAGFWMDDTNQGGNRTVVLLAWFNAEVAPAWLRIDRSNPLEVLKRHGAGANVVNLDYGKQQAIAQ